MYITYIVYYIYHVAAFISLKNDQTQFQTNMLAGCEQSVLFQDYQVDCSNHGLKVNPHLSYEKVHS